MITVYVPGGVAPAAPGTWAGSCESAPPPQPPSRPAPIARLNHRIAKNTQRDLRRLPENPLSITTANGSKNAKANSLGGVCSAAVRTWLLIVSVAVFPFLLALNDPGENVQLVPTGRLAQENVNCSFSAALFGLNESVTLADSPRPMLVLFGVAISGPAALVCCGARFIATPKTVLAAVPELNFSA